MTYLITNHVFTFSLACPYKSAMLNLTRSENYKVQNKAKTKFSSSKVLYLLFQNDLITVDAKVNQSKPRILELMIGSSIFCACRM
jgi:hypothetical protein